MLREVVKEKVVSLDGVQFTLWVSRDEYALVVGVEAVENRPGDNHGKRSFTEFPVYLGNADAV